jgi:hypothetical protein
MPSVTLDADFGIAPASLSAAIARSTSGWMPALRDHRAVAIGDSDDRLVEIAVAESTARSIARSASRRRPA